MALLLGLDISTTGAKALVIDEQGHVLPTRRPSIRSRPHTHFGQNRTQPIGGRVRTKSIQAALNQAGLSGADISCIGLTGRCTAWFC